MSLKEQLSETDLLLQFCSSLEKVKIKHAWSLNIADHERLEYNKRFVVKFQIYPKHKDLYNWVDVDQRMYVAYNVTYLQESFDYVSIYQYLFSATSYSSCSSSSYN